MLTARSPTLRDASLLALAAAAVATGSASAGAPKESAPKDEKTVGTALKASLKYADGSKNKVPAWTNIRVTIVRDGATVVTDQPLPPEASTSYTSPPKITAIDLDDDAEPEVLIDIFTAGAEPERHTVLLRKDGATYQAAVAKWGTRGYRLSDVAGGDSPEFLSADSRVPGLYDSEARGPLRVLGYDGGEVRDISRKARGELLRDAKRHRRALASARRNDQDARPELAAYALDLVRIGRISQAQSEIRASARRKELRGSAKSFARKLDRAMVRWGYAKRKTLAGGL